MLCPECILWLLCVIKWAKILSYLHNTYIWGIFWSKFGYLNPEDDHTEEYSPFILKKSHHVLPWMCFCSYVAWSNGSKCEVICISILPIFRVIAGKNLGIWLSGEIIYNVTLTFLSLILKKIPSWSIENVTLWIYIIVKVCKRMRICKKYYFLLFLTIFCIFYPLWSYFFQKSPQESI